MTPNGEDGAGDGATGSTRAASSYRVEALAKGLRLLSMFSERRPALRLSDIATEIDVPLPTVYRLAMTLVSEGFLEHLPDGSYRPGVKVLTLGHSALSGLELVELAAGPLHRLAAVTGETVNLGVLTGDQVLYISRIRNTDLVTANIQVGSLLPAVYTSMGKLLLAYLDDAELAERIGPGSFTASHGPRAVRSLDELRPVLHRIREDGWSGQDEELAHGLRSVAAPVRDSSGRVAAAANVAVRTQEWTMARIAAELCPHLVHTCDEISRLLGHR